eukprot:CAMPEP_0194399932 /NCGR_PEP_ID=MMETSP0174-20130528/126933_1 /TAXON_ID=216777 /ORGANISM="Proboscia alata, Strain PI-D3" /LENGTH=691 /DNA_ID=CAMNT_0039196393 /DNA_START=1382 /DNA_END=3460 /DNA_ORIENTATION=+
MTRFVLNKIKNGTCFGNHDKIFTRFILYMLIGMSDDSDDVTKISLQEMDETTSFWRKLVEGNRSSFEDSDATYVLRVSNSESFIYSFLPTALFMLLEDANNYFLERRIRVIMTFRIALQCLLRQTGGKGLIGLDAMIHAIVVMVCNYADDEEESIRNAAVMCAEVLGAETFFTRPALEILIPSVTSGMLPFIPRTGFRERASLASCLLVLGSLVRGVSGDLENTWIKHSFSFKICRVLTSPALMHMNSCQATMLALLSVCHTLVDIELKLNAMPDKIIADRINQVFKNEVTSSSMSFLEKSISTPDDEKDDKNTAEEKKIRCLSLLLCCLLLLGCPSDFKVWVPAYDFLQKLSLIFPQVVSGEELLDIHFCALVQNIISMSCRKDVENEKNIEVPGMSNRAVWEVNEPKLLCFDSLIRNCQSKTVGKHFEMVMPIFELHLGNGTKAQSEQSNIKPASIPVQLSILSLLETLFSDKACPQHLFQPFTVDLIENVLMPNLVWRVGGKASSLRKVTVASLYSLLRAGGATSRALCSVAPRLLPLLKSNLDDNDASTIQIVCLSLAMIFDNLPGMLGVEPVNHLYPDLIKCLDDSNDNVRFAAIKALKSFFVAASPCHFKGTVINYMSEQILIHMDDPNEKLQYACLDLLKAALKIDHGAVVKQVEVARVSHRSVFFCCELLQHASEVERLQDFA